MRPRRQPSFVQPTHPALLVFASLLSVLCRRSVSPVCVRITFRRSVPTPAAALVWRSENTKNAPPLWFNVSRHDAARAAASPEVQHFCAWRPPTRRRWRTAPARATMRIVAKWGLIARNSLCHSRIFPGISPYQRIQTTLL